MIPLKLRHFRQARRQLAFGISACLCLLVLAPAAYARTDSVDKLIRQLGDTDAGVRSRAASALGETKDPRAVEPLIAALKDTASYVRRYAADALGKIKDPRAVEPLIAILKDTDSFVRWNAAEALGAIKDPRAVEPLIAALSDPSPVMRRNAASALSQIKDPRVANALTGILNDSDPTVRRNAAEALGEINDPRAIAPLITALKDTDPRVRRRAADAFGNLSNQHALEAIAFDKSIESDVRETVISYLTDRDMLARIARDDAEVMVVRMAADPGTRKITLWRKAEMLMGGSTPLIEAVYDSSGNTVSAGGGVTLSGNFDNTLLNVSAIRGEAVSLGMQFSDDSQVADSGLSPAVGDSAFIDASGIVYSSEAIAVAEGGPFIAVVLTNSSWKPLRTEGLTVSAQCAGLPLKVRRDKDNWIFEAVPKHPVSLVISGSSGTRSLTLFPRFRSATPDAVTYQVRLWWVIGTNANGGRSRFSL